MANKNLITKWLQSTTVRVTRVQFIFIAFYIASIVVFDSWGLYTHSVIGSRWTAAAILLVITTICWYISRMKFSKDTIYIALLLTIIVADIIFAATNVYWERGLASKSVLLFSIPIIIAATMRSRTTVLATATLSVAAYSTSVIRYYNSNYGESLRIELYGYLGLLCAVFFIIALLMLIIIQPKDRY